MVRKFSPRSFFEKNEKGRLIQAIREAERQTSGEIRVYLERKIKGDTLERAKRIFEKLGMTKTRRRNGILIYFSLVNHSFAVLGDQGIHDRVGDSFWQEAVSTLQTFFARGEFVEGLEAGIRKIGEALRRHFPYETGDVNELRDEIQGNNGGI